MADNFASWKFRSEPDCVAALMGALPQGYNLRPQVVQQTRVLIEGARAYKHANKFQSMIEGFSLSTREGMALMALAEALLRVPDAATAEALLEDKLSDADFEKLFGEANDWLGKMSGLGLKLAQGVMGGMTKRMGMPAIRRAAIAGVKMLGEAFVMGETIEDAMAAANNASRGYAYSFDMLGEAARTEMDAQAYFTSYAHAISVLSRSVSGGYTDALKRHGISVKLSALHPRYVPSQSARCIPELAERLSELCRLAADANLNLTVDAEEVDRLPLSLQIIDRALQATYLKGWDGFGMAVQAYGKQAYPLLTELVQWSSDAKRKLNIRLVKGAYWDSEVKRAQVAGLPDYALFTRKAHTDLSYLACAQLLLDNRKFVTPMFGTHNASSVATILDLAGNDRSGFAFQRLYGMGEGLHAQILSMDIPCCIYAPVGPHTHLLAYLVRRLLENGANSSFVNRLANRAIPAEQLIENPMAAIAHSQGQLHPRIPLPRDLYAPERLNSAGWDLGEREVLKTLEDAARTGLAGKSLEAESIVNGEKRRGSLPTTHTSPQDKNNPLGNVWYADDAIIKDALVASIEGWKSWRVVHPDRRGQILERFAYALEANSKEFVALCAQEAGKNIPDAIAEIREAVDFCRYYAVQARKLFATAVPLPGPTGEQNSIRLEPRGTFVCISPWNFPLAIFVGQVTAALAAGNAVIAKPAEQTPLIAMRAIEMLIEAGVPANAIGLIQGDGRVGEMLVNSRGLAGVAFTGSNQAAKAIHKSLADRPGPILPLIAETGGINAMIVDSTALPEQVCDDVINSAFGSAGQRCSALRLLCVQEDVFDAVTNLIAGAMHEIVVGDPANASTDIGPLIDDQALAGLQRHRSRLRGGARVIAETPMDKGLKDKGHFFAPIMAEIRSIDDLDREVFGPALHVLRYRAAERDDLIESINRKGFGLTFGVHSRIFETQRHLANQIRAGNVYINRTMIGAIVGVQPFGGMGLSGTGPKAGGPYYLHAFATEKVISVDTTASGGNTSLIAMGDM
ncbi:MAG TPA: bifunctional proline dehydrogenase/L-glutamate gamma-semialdehyde dehydrogenase PutA [Alphaproteobacteria bacterium]